MVARRCGSVLSTNVSAQSPPWSRNARPLATSASRSCSLSTSGGNVTGGTLSSTVRTCATVCASGHSGCCAAGRASASSSRLRRSAGRGGSSGSTSTGASTDQFTILRVEPRRGLTRSGRLARRRPFWLSPIRTDSARSGNGYLPLMGTLLWILAVILVVAGIFAIIRRQLIWGIVLIIVGLLVGPGGVSIFT